MKTALFHLFLFALLNPALFAQTTLSGTWVCPLDKSEGYDNNGKEEHFRFEGGLNLDGTETMMVQQYMNMAHRLNMTAIDLIDGRQDFIWKWVDEYGNKRY